MNNEFNLQDYLANGVEIIIKDALRASIKNPKEILFLRSIPTIHFQLLTDNSG